VDYSTRPENREKSWFLSRLEAFLAQKHILCANFCRKDWIGLSDQRMYQGLCVDRGGMNMVEWLKSGGMADFGGCLPSGS